MQLCKNLLKWTVIKKVEKKVAWEEVKYKYIQFLPK